MKKLLIKNCAKCKKKFSAKSVNSTWCISCCTLKCQFCNVEIIVKPSRFKLTKYCSKECRRKSDLKYVWKDEDLEYIKTNYPYKLSLKEIADKYNTSINAVNRITTKLGCDNCPVELRNKRSGKSRTIWTEDVVIGKIKSFNKNGEKLNSDYIQKKYGNFHASACKLFGSWKQAIENAGFDYSKINLYSHRIHWDSQKIIADKYLYI